MNAAIAVIYLDTVKANIASDKIKHKRKGLFKAFTIVKQGHISLRIPLY